MKSLVVLSCLALVSVIFVPVASGQNYVITDLGPISPVGINVWGEVAGNLANGHAALWTPLVGTKDIGVLPGGKFSVAAGINDLGTITGAADGPGVVTGSTYAGTVSCSDIFQPFVWTLGRGFSTPASIPVVSSGHVQFPCLQVDYATGINLLGQVVGSNSDYGTYKYGLFWNGSKGVTNIMTTAYQSSANAINDFGVVAGQYSAAGELYLNSHVALWKNGVVTDLGGLSGGASDDDLCSGASSVSDMGTVAGWSSPYDSIDGFGSCEQVTEGQIPIHAIIWTSGSGFQDLGTLSGDSSSAAVKVNLFGQVIGMSGNVVTLDSTWHEYEMDVAGRPFVWSESTGMQDLNTLINPFAGWVLNTATDINEEGQIVGSGTKNGQVHGYLLTPKVPLI